VSVVVVREAKSVASWTIREPQDECHDGGNDNENDKNCDSQYSSLSLVCSTLKSAIFIPNPHASNFDGMPRIFTITPISALATSTEQHKP
jgi:hypothetical protein